MRMVEQSRDENVLHYIHYTDFCQARNCWNATLGEKKAAFKTKREKRRSNVLGVRRQCLIITG